MDGLHGPRQSEELRHRIKVLDWSDEELQLWMTHVTPRELVEQMFCWLLVADSVSSLADDGNRIAEFGRQYLLQTECIVQ